MRALHVDEDFPRRRENRSLESNHHRYPHFIQGDTVNEKN